MYLYQDKKERKNNDMNSLTDLGLKWVGGGGGIRNIEELYLLNNSPEVGIIE